MRFVVALACAIGCGGAKSEPPAPDGGTPVEVVFTISNLPSNPEAFETVVAYQDGDGAFVEAVRDGNTYTLPIRFGRYGVTWTCRFGTGGFISLAYFTVEEMPSLTVKALDGCTDAPANELEGTISGSATSYVTVFAEASHGVVLAPEDNAAFSFSTTSTPADLVAVRFANDITATAIQESDRIVVLRDQPAASNIAIDFAPAASPRITTFDVPAAPLDTLTIVQGSVVIGTTSYLLGQDARDTPGTALRVFGLPEAIEVPTDRYRVGTTVAQGERQFGEDRAFEALTDIPTAHFERMAPFIGNTQSDAFVPAISFDPHPTAQGYTYETVVSSAQAFVTVGATFSAAWLGEGKEFHVPDLGAVLDWVDEVVPTSAPSVRAQAEQSSLGVADLPMPFTIRETGLAGSVRASTTLAAN